jgi:hypothetical protein
MAMALVCQDMLFAHRSRDGRPTLRMSCERPVPAEGRARGGAQVVRHTSRRREAPSASTGCSTAACAPNAADVEQEPHDQEYDRGRGRGDAELRAEDWDAQQDEHTLRESGDEQCLPGPDVAAPVRSEHDGQEQDAVGRPEGGGCAPDPAQRGCDAGIAACDFRHPRVPDAVVVARPVRVDSRNHAEERDRDAQDGEKDPARLFHVNLRNLSNASLASGLDLATSRA